MRKIGEPRKLEIYNDLYWAVRIGTVKQTLEDLRDTVLTHRIQSFKFSLV